MLVFWRTWFECWRLGWFWMSCSSNDWKKVGFMKRRCPGRPIRWICIVLFCWSTKCCVYDPASDPGRSHLAFINAEGAWHAWRIPKNETERVVGVFWVHISGESWLMIPKLASTVSKLPLWNVEEWYCSKVVVSYTPAKEFHIGWMEQKKNIKVPKAWDGIDVWLCWLVASLQLKRGYLQSMGFSELWATFYWQVMNANVK